MLTNWNLSNYVQVFINEGYDDVSVSSCTNQNTGESSTIHHDDREAEGEAEGEGEGASSMSNLTSYSDLDSSNTTGENNRMF